MPRKQIYGTATDRHAAYRERATAERDRLNKIGLQLQGKLPPDPPPEVAKEPKWYKVEITVDRPEMPGPETECWVMIDSEVNRLVRDLSDYDDEKAGAAESGTYAFAESGGPAPGISGMMMLEFFGVSVTAKTPLKGYTPLPHYRVIQDATNILTSQRSPAVPIERRERPRCRQIINRLRAEKGCTLRDLIEGDEKHKISDAMQIQVRKMIAEEEGED